MTERFIGSSGPLSVSEGLDKLGYSLERMKRVSRAYTVAETVKECRGCSGGNIAVRLNDGEEYHVPCPVMAPKCEHGQKMHRQLEKYVLSWVKSLPGLPSRFNDALEKPSQTTAVHGVNIWSYEPNNFLLLHGEHGTGKSFGAAYALYVLARARLHEQWKNPLTWTPLGAMWVSAYRVTTKDELFEEARVKPVLVLDDLGAELPTNMAHYKIAEIISERNNHKRLTILTMNDDPMTLAKTYGDRSADRIFGDGKIVHCSGESLRLTA